MKSHKLPSGRTLKITLAPFSEGWALYQAVAAELKDLKIQGSTEMDYNFFKDIACAGMSSKRIDECVWKCYERCTIDDARILSSDLFESEAHREDYLDVMVEVMGANLKPFTKNLYALFSSLAKEVNKLQSLA